VTRARRVDRRGEAVSDPNLVALWAFLGEYPAAGVAVGPTVEAWQRERQGLVDTE
jgi:hypothetical protein